MTSRTQQQRRRLKGFINRSKGQKRSVPGSVWIERGKNAVMVKKQ